MTFMSRVTNILYPIHIDRWTNPIATLAREIATYNGNLNFYAFSGPITTEDKRLGANLWSQSHIHRLSLLQLFAEGFDIVHRFYMTRKSQFLSYFIGIKDHQSIHIFTANLQPYPGFPRLQLYRQAVLSADVIVAVSQTVALGVQEQFGRSVDAVIPNGVDLEFFSPDASSLTGSLSQEYSFKKPYIMFCAVLEERKRPDICIRLAELLPELDFVIIGRRIAESEVYLEMIRDLDNIKYLGLRPRSEVRDLMAGASALIFPSEWEGLPLTVLEASAMGLPVLAQPKSSLPEVVVPDVTGWLLPGDDLAAWKERIEAILNWPDTRRHSFGNTARQFVAQRYSWASVAEQHQELYRKLVD